MSFNGENNPTIPSLTPVTERLSNLRVCKEYRRSAIQSINENDTIEQMYYWEPIKAVAFDLYGTLAYIESGANAYKDAIEFALHNGHLLTKNQIQSVLTEELTVSELLNQCRKKLPEGVIQTFELQSQAEADSAKIYSDAKYILDHLNKINMPWTIGSNLAVTYSKIIDLLPFKPTVEEVFSFKVGCKKPDNEFFDIIRKRFNLKSNEILFIGDSPSSDINGALRAGFRAALISRNFIKPVYKGALRISSLFEVEELLESIGSKYNKT